MLNPTSALPPSSPVAASPLGALGASACDAPDGGKAAAPVDQDHNKVAPCPLPDGLPGVDIEVIRFDAEMGPLAGLGGPNATGGGGRRGR